MRLPFRAAAACVLALLSSACALTRPDSPTPASYDLGPQPAYAKSNPAIPGALLVPPVLAPAWLDGPAIVYRLMYEDAARPQAYALSRWSTDPASLMTQRLRSRFAAASGGVVTPGYSAISEHTLRIELEDFSQRFDAPGSSRATLRARATLLANNDRRLLGQRVFEIDRPAAPNAGGAVKALAEATHAFLEELVSWTAENTRKR